MCRIGRRFGGGWGLGGITIIVVLGLLFGKSPGDLLQLPGGMEGVAPATQENAPAGNDEQTEFVRQILGSTEDVWGGIFGNSSASYAAPRLVLFTGGVQSACGATSSAMGSFYCPGAHQVYLDLDFFREIQQRFNAAGDFARAYVIAHEVGHHVQNLTGIMQKVQAGRQRGLSMEGATGLSVRQELQADCYAGVWANQAHRQRIGGSNAAPAWSCRVGAGR